jgi:hypothetical protein
VADVGRLVGLLRAIAIDGKWLRGVGDGRVKLFAAMLHGSGPYFWVIAVSARAGNGVGGPPGTQDGTRGATGPQAGSSAVTGDTCEAHVPGAEDRATSSSRDMRQPL